MAQGLYRKHHPWVLHIDKISPFEQLTFPWPNYSWENVSNLAKCTYWTHMRHGKWERCLLFHSRSLLAFGKMGNPPTTRTNGNIFSMAGNILWKWYKFYSFLIENIFQFQKKIFTCVDDRKKLSKKRLL